MNMPTMESVSRFKAAMDSDRGALGPFMICTDPAMVEAAGRAGYDFVLLDMEQESLADLNALAQVADTLSTDDLKKLGAVVTMAKPQNAEQIKNLAESLDLFDFAPGAHTPEEYGKYMIQQSGRFEYDENLDAFYDYEKYGTERMNAEDGMFTDRGYIAYKGYYSMEEVMNGSQSSRMEMGGFSR